MQFRFKRTKASFPKLIRSEGKTDVKVNLLHRILMFGFCFFKKRQAIMKRSSHVRKKKTLAKNLL